MIAPNPHVRQKEGQKGTPTSWADIPIYMLSYSVRDMGVRRKDRQRCVYLRKKSRRDWGVSPILSRQGWSVRPVFVQPVFVQRVFVQSFSSNPIRLGLVILGQVSLGQVMIGRNGLDGNRSDENRLDQNELDEKQVYRFHTDEPGVANVSFVHLEVKFDNVFVIWTI